MNPSENFIKRTPFDLHVLGAPPAFVLSQDQTLNKIVSLPPSGRLRSFDLTQALACVITCVKEYFSLFRIYKDSNVISDIQVDAVQFSRCSAAVARQLINDSTAVRRCQLLFSQFCFLFSAIEITGRKWYICLGFNNC